jgi:hypothetical protein
MRSRPYRNDRIIKAIQILFFTGENSFAKRFRYLFPTYEGPDGVVHREVPEPMLALVGTAVRCVPVTLIKCSTNGIQVVCCTA